MIERQIKQSCLPDIYIYNQNCVNIPVSNATQVIFQKAEGLYIKHKCRMNILALEHPSFRTC